MDLDVEPDAVILVAGIPGAGKTTLIDRAVDRTRAVVVDTDDRRREGRASRWKAVRVAGHYRRILTAVLGRADLPVVVHSRGTTALARGLVAALARLRGRPAHLVLLVAAPGEAVDGQRRRGRTIPACEMEGHVERFAGVIADRGALARREGWSSVTVLDRAGAARVKRIGVLRSDDPGRTDRSGLTPTRRPAASVSRPRPSGRWAARGSSTTPATRGPRARA